MEARRSAVEQEWEWVASSPFVMPRPALSPPTVPHCRWCHATVGIVRASGNGKGLASRVTDRTHGHTPIKTRVRRGNLPKGIADALGTEWECPDVSACGVRTRALWGLSEVKATLTIMPTLRRRIEAQVDRAVGADTVEKRLRAAEKLLELAHELELDVVRRARAEGRTWDDIAAALGVSKQAVHKRFSTEDEGPGRARAAR